MKFIFSRSVSYAIVQHELFLKILFLLFRKRLVIPNYGYACFHSIIQGDTKIGVVTSKAYSTVYVEN